MYCYVTEKVTHFLDQSDGRECFAYYKWSASKSFYITFRYMTVTDKLYLSVVGGRNSIKRLNFRFLQQKIEKTKNNHINNSDPKQFSLNTN